MHCISIRTASTDQELEDLFAARWRVLREPLGLERGTERDPADDRALHLIAVQAETVIGGARLGALSPEEGSIAYVFVLPEFQHQGVGTRLMQAAIEQATQLHFKQLRLMTRASAQAFYERLGFAAAGDLFDYIGIPHRFMELKLSVD